MAAPLMIPLMIAGTALSAASTISGAKAQSDSEIAAGDAQLEQSFAQQRDLDFEADQLDNNAKQERATGQRNALEARRESRLAQSTLQARAASSGGGATDPTVLDLAAGLAGRGEYQSLLAMASGENAAVGLEEQARGNRITGESIVAGGQGARKASVLKAGATRKAARYEVASTIIGGGTSVGKHKAGKTSFG